MIFEKCFQKMDELLANYIEILLLNEVQEETERFFEEMERKNLVYSAISFEELKKAVESEKNISEIEKNIFRGDLCGDLVTLSQEYHEE